MSYMTIMDRMYRASKAGHFARMLNRIIEAFKIVT